MITAGFISSAPNWPWSRQFPNAEPTWDGVSFQFDSDFSACDIVFVFDAIPKELCGRIKAKRAVFICSEPPNVKVYRPDFLSQFDQILTTDAITKHPNKLLCQVGLPWHVGVWDNGGDFRETPLSFNDFRDFYPIKTKLVSIVSSDKAFTEEHRLRLDFFKRLKSYFGNEMDFFGRNINNFPDKTNVLCDYKYHIAIENCSTKHYWTEKLSDPLLALTYPIYHGCPNIAEYFSEQSLTRIDINDYENIIRTIESIINSDIYDKAIPHLEQARKSILSKFNLFAVLSDIAKIEVAKRRSSRILESERFYRKYNPIVRAAKRNIRRILPY